MNIVEHEIRADWFGTYFRTGDVEPEFKDGVLFVYSGRGPKRSWGQSGVNSIVALNDDDLTSILVGFFHKHGGSQFWRHYKNGKRLMWKSLEEQDRMRILDAFAADIVPGWANIPGKLKRDYVVPSHHNKVERDNAGNIIAYKYLRMSSSGNYVSPTYPVEWTNNCLVASAIPTEDNSCGIYAAKTSNSPILEVYKRRGNITLVRLILSGTVVEANYGYRAERADIFEVLL